MHLHSSEMGEPKRRTIAAIHKDILFRAVTVHITIEQQAPLARQRFQSFLGKVDCRMPIFAWVSPVPIQIIPRLCF
jgi:hypothetical protein